MGACVGMKGSRIHGIVRELRNENIDVINYTSNLSLFIQRALSPAKISSIRVNEEEKKAEVYLRPEEVSLAIGKGGLNIKLAYSLPSSSNSADKIAKRSSTVCSSRSARSIISLRFIARTLFAV